MIEKVVERLERAARQREAVCLNAAGHKKRSYGGSREEHLAREIDHATVTVGLADLRALLTAVSQVGMERTAEPGA